MQKNVASQKLIVFAFDSTTNLPKTGDAANITAYVSIDYGTVTVLGDTSATEMDSTNAKGYYLFDLTQAETNGNTLLFSAKSGTANIVVIGVPAVVQTVPSSFVVAPGSANALLVAGSNAATTFAGLTTGALSCTTVTASGTVSLAAVTTSGTVTLNALTVTNATNLTGAITFGSTWGVTGAVTFTAGLTSNITGTLSTVTNLTNLPAITAGWLTATGIAAAALNGKGDWLLSSSYTAPLTAAGTRSAVGLASANLDTQLATLDADILTRLATTSYTTPPTTAQITTAVLTTQMAESYSADGVAPTLAQSLFLVMQRLTEFSIISTTITVKKLDGSTTAYTLTLNDATNPTSSTRAT